MKDETIYDVPLMKDEHGIGAVSLQLLSQWVGLKKILIELYFIVGR